MSPKASEQQKRQQNIFYFCFLKNEKIPLIFVQLPEILKNSEVNGLCIKSPNTKKEESDKEHIY